MQLQWSGEEMLEAFRARGGTAENVRLEEGALFPHDPEQPVRLRVPENLLFPLEAFEIAEGSLRLQDAEGVSPATRAFFERYEHAFGRAIFAHAAAAIAALESLPARAKEVLNTGFGMGTSFAGSKTRRIERWFVERRAIRRAEGKVIAPVLELAKHDPNGLAIEQDRGVRVAGPAGDGIGVFHPFHDALAVFQRFGLAAAQPAAFSLPMSFAADGMEISIERNMHLGERRGEVTLPQFNVVAHDSLSLSHLMLGHSASPRLARGIFRARLREADVKDPDWQFDRIVQENMARLLRLLDLLEGEEGQTVLSLRRMARHQLEAISCSVGAREI